MHGRLFGFDLINQMNATGSSMFGCFFSALHSIEGHYGVAERKLAEQGLHGRDLVGSFITIKMRQHQSRVRSEGAEHVRCAAIKEVVEAASQGLAIDRADSGPRHRHSSWRHGGATEAGSSSRRTPRIVV
jgi:hypothetical protein